MRPSMVLFGIAAIMSVSITTHFGWNWTPQSTEEFVADTLVLIFYGISYLAFLLEKRP